MRHRSFQIGEWIVYRMAKCRDRPGKRASDILPAERGELYRYHVDKFWLVTDVSDDEKSIVAKTRRGKVHVLDADDPELRHTTWWERWRYRHKFPPRAAAESNVSSLRG